MRPRMRYCIVQKLILFANFGGGNPIMKRGRFFNVIVFIFILSLKLCHMFKGATKLYFTHYLCVVIIFYNTGLYESGFSPYYFQKLVYHLPMFYVLCLLWVFNSISFPCRIITFMLIIVHINAIWPCVILQVVS